MAQINFAKREVQCKVVYYGPAHSGKTANLRSIHDRSPEKIRGKLTSIATDGDRTLFFDYLPLDLGEVAGIRAKINLYAVPYIDAQNALRLLVLEGADGIVFVADSARDRLDANREALDNLVANLAAIGRDLSEIPIVFQWNRSDAIDALPPEELARALDVADRPAFTAIACEGSGVLATLKAVTQRVLEHVSGVMKQSRAAPAIEVADEPLEKVRDEERPSQPAEDQPVFRPRWHQHAPDENTNSNPNVFAELSRRALPAARAPRRAPAPEKAPIPEPPVHDDEPLEIARDDAPAQPPEPPAFVLDRVADLKSRGREAERAPTGDGPRDDADWGKPRRKSGLVGPPPVAEDAPEERRLVTVGGGGARGATRRKRQRNISWDRSPAAAAGRAHDGAPVGDRRRRTRAQWRAQRIPASQMAAGALFALVWLAATGYLVKELL